MMAEQVEPETFKPPQHKPKPNIETKTWSTPEGIHLSICPRWNLYWNNTFNRDDDRHRQLWTSITETYPIVMKHYQWVKDEIENLQQQK